MERPPPTASIDEKKQWIEDAGGRPSEAQLEKVAAVVRKNLPLRDGADLAVAMERVSWIFGNYYRSQRADVAGFRDKKAREAGALELESLFRDTCDSTQFTLRSHELSPLARWALYGALHDDGVGGVVLGGARGDHRFRTRLRLPMFASEGRVEPRFEDVHGRFERVGTIQTNNDARELALEAARRLRGSLGAGRRPEAAELALAKNLAQIWVEMASRGLRSEKRLAFSEKKRSRSPRERIWYYREFVEAIARILTPDFNGEGVCQRVVRMPEFQVTRRGE